MSIYESTEKMYQILGDLWNQILDHPVNGPKLKEANIIVKFNITDPKGTIWITPNDGVILGDASLTPDIEQTLSGDTIHKYWLKQISGPVAMATGKIKSKGSLMKGMKLNPLLSPAYTVYPELVEKYGIKG